ncbi:Ig-like domain-containing protein [Rothia sp. ZJ932]|uniref:L,D-transpeptidase n=1 Tax=Rothia sp. ZJ932 TaxID=2810516 RepID=UPI001966EED5|nr:Ig-like domain-containing protein [Rothia sp. ZJ932]QRZ61221.1 L,D-transpeptidase family protein [Rothia sp. ZJ932]
MAFSPRDSVTSRRQALSFTAVGAASVFGLAACSTAESESTGSSASASAAASSTPSASPTQKFVGSVAVTPEKDAVEFNPVLAVNPVVATATDATFTSVKLMAGKANIAGELSEDKTTWTSTEDLAFDTEYTLKWEAEDAEGGKGKGSSVFTTVSAVNEANAMTNLKEGAVYGVGQIIQINFSEPVINKDAVEKLIEVTGNGVTEPRVRWYSDYMARVRTKDYLPANTDVAVKVNILGVDLGNGMIGNSNTAVNFKTSEKRYALADNNTKTMKMYVNDELVHTAPITLGNAEWPSVVGQLVIQEQAPTYKFDPTTLGLDRSNAHWYEPFTASWTSRLTDSGVFVHQALPSAWGSVGYYNVSHGCIGMLLADAKFFFDTFDVGDVVETVNTGYLMADPDNGYGDWNIPFDSYADENYRGNW